MNTIDQRQRYILEEIERRGSVNVIELAQALTVSEMTIRRDLNDLEKVGLVRRVHGGAVSARGRSYEPPLSTRSVENRTAKQILGRYAAEMVAEGDSVALDTGSTIYEVAQNLKEVHNITVVSPSIPIASLFFDRVDVRVILPGGVVRPTENSLVGDFTRQTLELMFVDRLFLGVGAIDSNSGLSEYNLEDAAVKQCMIKNAKEVFLVADSSKFEKVAFAYVAPLRVLHHLITDQEPPRVLLETLKKHDIDVHVVSETGVRIC